MAQFTLLYKITMTKTPGARPESDHWPRELIGCPTTPCAPHTEHSWAIKAHFPEKVHRKYHDWIGAIPRSQSPWSHSERSIWLRTPLTTGIPDKSLPRLTHAPRSPLVATWSDFSAKVDKKVS